MTTIKAAYCHLCNVVVFVAFQAQSDDDDAGDDVAVNVDAGGFMEEFFEQVLLVPLVLLLIPLCQG